jgi:hypothetical protein
MTNSIARADMITFKTDLEGQMIEFRLAGSGSAMIDYGDGTDAETVYLSELLTDHNRLYDMLAYLHPYTFTKQGMKTVTITGAVTAIITGRTEAVTDVNTGGMPGLLLLDCCKERLTELDVTGNMALKTLDCSDNELMHLDVSNNIALTTLDCSRNNISKLLLMEIFTELPQHTAEDHATIICGGNPGYDALTEADKSILAKKNWKIID